MPSNASAVGSLIFVGDGPLRDRARGPRAGAASSGRVAHAEVPATSTSADVVCAPSLLEPFGQSILEAMACGQDRRRDAVRRPARVRHARGRHPRRSARRRGALLGARGGDCVPGAERGRPSGSRGARRQASGGAGGGDSASSRSRSASLTSTSGRIRSSTPSRAREFEGLLVALAHLGGLDALLQSVVARQQCLVDLISDLILHARSVFVCEPASRSNGVTRDLGGFDEATPPMMNRSCRTSELRLGRARVLRGHSRPALGGARSR